MEGQEKKRKGYKTQAQQTEAMKRYRNTENGKKALTHANYKSKCKAFINKYASLEELAEIKNLIEEKIKEG